MERTENDIIINLMCLRTLKENLHPSLFHTAMLNNAPWGKFTEKTEKRERKMIYRIIPKIVLVYIGIIHTDIVHPYGFDKKVIK